MSEEQIACVGAEHRRAQEMADRCLVPPLTTFGAGSFRLIIGRATRGVILSIVMIVEFGFKTNM
jgi:hypothetical protein